MSKATVQKEKVKTPKLKQTWRVVSDEKRVGDNVTYSIIAEGLGSLAEAKAVAHKINSPK